MNRNPRIELGDDIKSCLMKLCEGKPGALTVLLQTVKNDSAIDPDSAFGPYSSILSLDSLGIYGPSIWILYKDVCKEDVVNFVGLLRGNQLGFISDEEIVAASESRGVGENSIDVAKILAQVREELPNFKR